MKNSKLNRIYINTLEHVPNILSIDCPNRIHYMRNVIRLRLSDKIRIFNEIIGEYIAKVILCDKKEIQLEIQHDMNSRKVHIPQKLYIAPCMVKNDRFSSLIDNAVQQGVTGILPVISEYTNNRKFSKERIERIIEEAVEQSERFDLPNLEGAINLKEINFEKYDAVIFANEREDKNFDISDIFKKENILLITGPEGGFSDQEIAFLNSLSNSYSISLGPRVLRAEVAMNALISNVNFVRGK